jgi:hypothetical protein
MKKIFEALLAVAFVAAIIVGVLCQWYPQFREPFRLFLGVMLVSVGATSAMGIWLPSFRSKWKGSSVDCGPLSCASMALFACLIGCAMFFGPTLPKRLGPWFAVSAMVCWILGCVGYSLDVRKWRRKVLPMSLAGSTPKAIPDERRGWEFAALGFSLLLVVMWVLFRGK